MNDVLWTADQFDCNNAMSSMLRIEYTCFVRSTLRQVEKHQACTLRAVTRANGRDMKFLLKQLKLRNQMELCCCWSKMEMRYRQPLDRGGPERGTPSNHSWSAHIIWKKIIRLSSAHGEKVMEVALKTEK